MSKRHIVTQRLRLREWRNSDLDAFAKLNADPRVMQYFPTTLSRDDSRAAMERIRTHFSDHGFGLWAVEVTNGAPFIGFVGLVRVPFEAEFTPAVEVGWRLAYDHWNHGYATEAARAAIGTGFVHYNLEQIVSMTVPANARSRAVMHRLGFTRNAADDFDHPRLPTLDPLLRHVLYRLSREQWVANILKRRCTIRRVAPRESSLATQLVTRSKALWGYDADFIAQCRDELVLDESYIRTHHVEFAEHDGWPVGLLSLEHVSDHEVELGRLFVEPAFVKRGVGRFLLSRAAEVSRLRKYTRLRIIGDPHASGFYSRLGARAIGSVESATIPGRRLPLFQLDL